MKWNDLINFAIAFGLASVAGCPAGEEGVGGSETDDDSGGSTSSSSSPMSVTLTTAPASTTVPATSTTDSTSASESDATASETSEPTTSDSTHGSTATTEEPTAGDSSSSGTTGGPLVGVCVQSCREDQDCCPFGAVFCPSDQYPDNYACNEGICEFGGCADDADCESLFTNDECHPIDGIGTCFEPCEDDNDCFDSECIGTADDGTMFCTTEVPPCEEDADCDGAGVCDLDSGSCYCESSDQCEDPELDACSVD